MKKRNFFSLLLCIFYFGLFGQKNNTQALISYFNEIKVPFNSDQINNVYKELPYKLALNSFFKKDTALSYFLKEVYNQEDNTLMSSNYEKKIILPRNYFYLKNDLFLIYKLIDDQEDSFTYLSLMDSEGRQLDSLVISFEPVSAPELYRWIRAKVYEDKVLVFEYKRIAKKNRDSTNNATSITVNHYAIDFVKNRFVETKAENFKSKYELYQLNEPDSEEIKNADPFYQY
jgi:hypothetical protein